MMSIDQVAKRAYEATEARVRSSGGQLVRPSEVGHG